jgi:hypothetical protein
MILVEGAESTKLLHDGQQAVKEDNLPLSNLQNAFRKGQDNNTEFIDTGYLLIDPEKENPTDSEAPEEP